MLKFDVLVIGGGPGGYVASIRAARLGARTALVEKAELGGTCLNRGCIPTKAFLTATEKVAELKRSDKFGITVSGLNVDFARMVEWKNSVVTKLSNGVNYLINHNKIEVYYGTACFIDSHTVEVRQAHKTERVAAAKIIIATGSVPRKLDLPGDTSCIIYSDDILNLQEIPENLVIIGGGVIGIEFGTIFNNLGTKVTIVEIMDRILPQMDGEIASLLLRQLKQEGIQILTGNKVEMIKQINDSAIVTILGNNSARKEIRANKVLVAPGRVPYMEGLNLDAAGVTYKREGIVTNENLVTTAENIYAIGDVTGGVQLAHLASAQGISAAEHALGKKPNISFKHVPLCIYTQPEVASVGLTEEQLKQEGTNFKAAKFPLRANGKAVAAGYEEGIVKILYDPQYGEIFGVHLLAPRATDIIAEAALALRSELTVDDIATTIHGHPTLAEALMEASHIAHGSPIHSA
ncbi:MAG: dihydrolipoyl dehydrogenase [Eubacteriales bacterium]